jgi:hypothetical protein
MEALVDRLAANLAALEADIAETCARAGRDPTTIEILAISKYATALETRALALAMQARGLPVRLGENRVQELSQKASALAGDSPPIHWDLVGTLQSNKAARALAIFERIHSLDRDSILVHLDHLAAAHGRRIVGFLQVNVGSEQTKHGYAPTDLGRALDLARTLPRLDLIGLMAMAPWGTDHDSARAAFARVRELRDRIAPGLPHLSMGMSSDYRGAILEGATILRIGSILFQRD